MAHHRHRAKALIRRAHDLDRWRDPTPVRPGEKRRWQAHRRAILHRPVRLAIGRYRDRRERRFERHRRQQRSDCIAGVTVYSGLGGCWAIPAYIVACESGGSWGAYNGSGAAGPYQLMPMWGRPFPIADVVDKRAHHRIAARLYDGGAGASNWVCS
ncbi:MAG: hypothetical protein ACRDLD_02235 [Thermoleophilaceae bacterium]